MNGSTLRTWHANISAFITPMVLFFALSGTLQIFDLHESHDGYTAPPFLGAVGSLHKDQIFAPPPQHQRPGMGAATGAPGAGAPADDAEAGPAKHSRLQPVHVYLLKWLFALEALGLVATALFGVAIGLTHAKRKRTTWILLIAGVIVPVVLNAL